MVSRPPGSHGGLRNARPCRALASATRIRSVETRLANPTGHGGGGGSRDVEVQREGQGALVCLEIPLSKRLWTSVGICATNLHLAEAVFEKWKKEVRTRHPLSPAPLLPLQWGCQQRCLWREVARWALSSRPLWVQERKPLPPALAASPKGAPGVDAPKEAFGQAWRCTHLGHAADHLDLGFLPCKMGIITEPTSRGGAKTERV